MKKTYIAPRTVVALFDTEGLLCLSAVSGKATSNEVLSNRRGGFFDDDDEW